MTGPHRPSDRHRPAGRGGDGGGPDGGGMTGPHRPSDRPGPHLIHHRGTARHHSEEHRP